MTEQREGPRTEEHEGQSTTPTPSNPSPCQPEVNSLPVLPHHEGGRVLPRKAERHWDEDMGQMVEEDDHPIRNFDLPEDIANAVLHRRNPMGAATALLAHLGKDKWELAERILRACRDVFPKQTLKRVLPMLGQPKLVDYQSNYFVVKDFGGKVRVCWFNHDGEFRTRSTQSFKEAEENVKVDVTVETTDGPKTTRVEAAKHWLKHANRAEFDEAKFAPGRLLPGNIFNLWHGWPVGWAYGYPKLMLAHMLDHMCDGDQKVLDWVLGWLAHAVQRPDETITTALVLAGPQGSGKNVFVKLLFELFAPHTLMCTQSGQLVGNFNAHLMDKAFVFANEAFFAGNKKEANVLKSLVTDETMMVEPKGVDAFQVRKHFRLILASNEARVVDLETDDRRYCVLNVDSQEWNNNRGYFRELIEAWRERGEREMFMRLLMDWPLDNWNEDAIPETLARQEQRELSLPPAAREVHELLEAGRVSAVARDPSTGAVAVLPRDGWSKSHGHFLRKAGAERGQVSGHGRVWWLRALSEAREHWSEAIGVRPDWQKADWLEWDVDEGCLKEMECPF
ncbi:MAG: primase-helicase family protein [Pseudomonadota bacterium]